MRNQKCRTVWAARRFPLKPAVFAMALLAGLLTSPFAYADALDFATARGSLKVGVAEEDFIPWLAKDKSGNRIGFEIDVATGVADALGVPAEFIEIPFDNLLQGLAAGEVDVVISAISISAERARGVFFSAPYSTTDFTLVVDKSNLPEAAADQGYDVEGFKVGVAQGTLSEAAATAEFRHAEIVKFQSDGGLRDAFIDKVVQGAIAPTPYPDFIVSRDPDRYEKEQSPLLSTRQAMAVRPDSPRLLNFLNAWVIESEANGHLAQMSAYWFENTDWFDRLEGYETEPDEGGDGVSAKRN